MKSLLFFCFFIVSSSNLFASKDKSEYIYITITYHNVEFSGAYKGETKKQKINGKKVLVPNGQGEFNAIINRNPDTLSLNRNANLMTYTGFWVLGKFEGEGELSIAGNKIKGVFNQGELNGPGTGNIGNTNYVGMFVNGSPKGMGKLVSPEFDYEGEVENWQANGNGKIVYKGFSASYNGGVKENKRHGYGVMTFSNPFLEFKGNWSNGNFNGEGKISMIDFTFDGIISSYDPEKKILSGTGKLLYRDGSNFTGEVKDNILANGTGTKFETKYDEDIEMTVLDKYEGEFRNGKANGNIVWTRTYKDAQGYVSEVDTHGSVYEGTMVNSKMHGKGHLILEEEGVSEDYTGDFVNGLKEGIGVWSGNSEYLSFYYEGAFSNDQINGVGKLTETIIEFETETTCKKIYEGNFVKGSLNGQGKLIDCDGSVYVGEFKNGDPNGLGRKTLKNGTVLEGKFIGGEYQKPFTCKSVKIGNTIWMAENLKVKNFRNGDAIFHATTQEEWANAHEKRIPAWCYYNFDPKNESKYGVLYNLAAFFDSRGLAPEGWTLPTRSNWESLRMLKNENENFADFADKLKSKTGWNQYSYGRGKYEGNGTNTSGFSALPSGTVDYAGRFSGLGSIGGWWCYDNNVITVELINSKVHSSGYYGLMFNQTLSPSGMAVRCLKN